MIFVDHALIAEARTFSTGANIHTLRNMIFVYEQAVALHNAGRLSHRDYQSQYEQALRQFVAEQKAKSSGRKRTA